MNKNFYIQKDGKTGDAVYIEFDKIQGYRVTPKAKKDDLIEVNKIVFVSNNLSEKIIKKKIEHRIAYLLRMLDENDGSDDEGAIVQSLMDAEKLRLMIINNYAKYLGNTYQSLTLKKMQIIINQLRVKLYTLKEPKVLNTMMNYQDNYQENYEEEEEVKRGRGR